MTITKEIATLFDCFNAVIFNGFVKKIRVLPLYSDAKEFDEIQDALNYAKATSQS